MEVEYLLQYLKDNGEELKKSILDGRCRPNPVRRVEIPKDNGKKRKLGIPTAVDRVVQQAIAQKLSRYLNRNSAKPAMDSGRIEARTAH